ADAPQANRRIIAAPESIAADLLPERAEVAALATAAGQPLTVAAESDGVDVVRSAGERFLQRAVGDAPDLHRRVVAAAGEPLPAGMKGNADHRLLVPGERTHQRAVVHAPDFHGLVEAAAGEKAAVGAEVD